MINSKLKALKWLQHISRYKYMGILYGRSRAANSTVQGLIWSNFEPVPICYGCPENPFKNEGARVVITLFIDFFQTLNGNLLQSH